LAAILLLLASRLNQLAKALELNATKLAGIDHTLFVVLQVIKSSATYVSYAASNQLFFNSILIIGVVPLITHHILLANDIDVMLRSIPSLSSSYKTS